MSTNVFFHNQKGKSFLQKEKEFGLEDFIHTHSYTYIDYDLDGDLDILSTGNYAPLRLFKTILKRVTLSPFHLLTTKETVTE